MFIIVALLLCLDTSVGITPASTCMAPQGLVPDEEGRHTSAPWREQGLVVRRFAMATQTTHAVPPPRRNLEPH
jgi:hypothetical protein